MNETVFDSSVYLAMLLDEVINPSTFDLVADSVVSAVNLAEVLTKVIELGVKPYKTRILFHRVRRIEPFTASQAHIASSLRRDTVKLGLSLGDRACLALAIELGAEVYTADRIWAKAEVPCKIHLVR